MVVVASVAKMLSHGGEVNTPTSPFYLPLTAKCDCTQVHSEEPKGLLASLTERRVQGYRQDCTGGWHPCAL